MVMKWDKDMNQYRAMKPIDRSLLHMSYLDNKDDMLEDLDRTYYKEFMNLISEFIQNALLEEKASAHKLSALKMLAILEKCHDEEFRNAFDIQENNSEAETERMLDYKERLINALEL